MTTFIVPWEMINNTHILSTKQLWEITIDLLSRVFVAYAESNGPLTYDEYVTLLTIDWAAIFCSVQMIMQANSCNRQEIRRDRTFYLFCFEDKPDNHQVTSGAM